MTKHSIQFTVNYKSLLLILALLVSSSCSARYSVDAALESGDKAYESGNYKESVKWFRRAAEQGSVEGQRRLGWAYENALGVAIDYREAMKWYLKGVEKNDAGSENNLGGMYFQGHGVGVNYQEAMKWYLKSAEKNEPLAQSNLGVMYANGDGVPVNINEAIKWFRKAAAQENSTAKENLIPLLIEQGESAARSSKHKEAFPLYLEAAVLGNAAIQLRVSSLYFFGLGVPKNHSLGVMWLQKSADQGYSDAQAALGAMYYEGSDVLKANYAEAVKWLGLAANQGNAGAQKILGDAYMDGHGVLKDEAVAMRWFRSSATLGDVLAQIIMCRSYTFGMGVPKDLIQAYAWCNVAASQVGRTILDDQTPQYAARARVARDGLEQLMTADQISRAQVLSRTLVRGIDEEGD